MIGRIGYWIHWTKRWFSRSEWLVRLMGLPRRPPTHDESGLILIQIDGLSEKEFKRALEKGNLPFIKRLLEKEKYHRVSMYSGVPSTTPAVQGELFYGIRQAVPSFSFLSPDSDHIHHMLEADCVESIESTLRSHAESLLSGGSSYSNIYSAQAAEAHFCAENMKFATLVHNARPWLWPFVFVMNSYSLLRALSYAFIELGISLYDFVHGVWGGRDFFKELTFIPSRVVICILLRELNVMGARMDIARGLPVISLNFVGYDEQAHRRGPTSDFAHWVLKGIDDAIKRIWTSAQKAQRLHYDVWIYSDHGQEEVEPYIHKHKRTVAERIIALYEAKSNHAGDSSTSTDIRHRGDSLRAGWIHSQWERQGIQRSRSIGLRRRYAPRQIAEAVENKRPLVAAMGPLGQVYWPVSLSEEQKQELANQFIEELDIPLVFFSSRKSTAIAMTASGRYELPEDALRILGRDHPHAAEVAKDLAELCRHPLAGDFIISGWRLDAKPLSFPMESGAHGGPGRDETSAFALLPSDVQLSPKSIHRFSELREAALSHLQSGESESNHLHWQVATETRHIRIMTYNVHRCIGTDGRLSPRRIARVIAQHDPDVVALQELDVKRMRTGGIDQAHRIAQYLRMEHQFHPTVQVAEEAYGDAILSRLPMKLVKSGTLPGMGDASIRREPRGALWVTVELEGRPLHIFNTHLGLSARERVNQIEALMDGEWLRSNDCTGPIVFCGDLNASPKSPVYARLSSVLRDVQMSIPHRKAKCTWFGRYPIGRIDHIFVSDELNIRDAYVADSHAARCASDHRPLIAELAIDMQVTP